MDEILEIPAGALDALAIFPLPDLVFFPGSLLPLHIFEPRYREMIGDVLAGSGLLAVVRLLPGFEPNYKGRPPVADIAGVGACVSADRLPDGRYNLMLRGLGRVRLDEELAPDTSYRRARCRLLPDSRSSRAERLDEGQRTLIALCDRLASVVPEGEVLRQLARALPTPGGCADAVANALVRDPEARQTLLELLDPADRLDQVAMVVNALVARMDPSRGSNLN